MSHNSAILTIVQNLEGSFLLSGETYDLRNRLFSLRQGAESCWIWECVYLLDQLKGHEIENECLLNEYNNHHILSKLDIHDKLVSIESDLCSIFLLVIIPNDNLIPLLLIDQNDHIGFIHHFYKSDVLVEFLHLLLES